MFNAHLNGGAQVARPELEAAILAHGKTRGEDYKIQWDFEPTKATELATRGKPFVLPLLSGETYDFGQVLGKRAAVVVFWASWCAPCLEEAPHLVKLHETYGPKGVEFISVSIDASEDHPALRKVAKDRGVTYGIALDPDGEVLAQHAKGASIPLTFVLDSTGAVVFSHRNYEAGDEVKLEAAIRSVASD